MNGVHDLGGMHGFGPIEREANEPLFHADWEARVRAIATLTRGPGLLQHRRVPLRHRAHGAGRLPAGVVLRALAGDGRVQPDRSRAS